MHKLARLDTTLIPSCNARTTINDNMLAYMENLEMLSRLSKL